MVVEAQRGDAGAREAIGEVPQRAMRARVLVADGAADHRHLPGGGGGGIGVQPADERERAAKGARSSLDRHAFSVATSRVVTASVFGPRRATYQSMARSRPSWTRCVGW